MQYFNSQIIYGDLNHIYAHPGITEGTQFLNNYIGESNITTFGDEMVLSNQDSNQSEIELFDEMFNNSSTDLESTQNDLETLTELPEDFGNSDSDSLADLSLDGGLTEDDLDFIEETHRDVKSVSGKVFTPLLFAYPILFVPFNDIVIAELVDRVCILVRSIMP